MTLKIKFKDQKEVESYIGSYDFEIKMDDSEKGTNTYNFKVTFGKT
jgi:hypothetical protein